MQRIDAPEILDSDECSSQDTQAALAVLGRINRWFGGVATTQKIVERAAQVMRAKQFSMLDVAAGTGEVPELVRRRVARRGIRLDVTLLDAAHSHLPGKDGAGKHCVPCSVSVVADAQALPFDDDAFDLVSCNLFAHHLSPQQLAQFARESLRVSRQALLINDLVRHPLHLALVYASFPIMRNRVAWLDGLTSVRRAYIPSEIRSMLASALGSGARVEISRHYLFRMGVIVWKHRV
jgi:ubiquinone/menaquinone biosynthesis C-methylase UbiE